MHGGQIFRLPLGISWQHWIHTPKPFLLWLRLNRGWSSFLVLYLACFHTSFGWLCLGILTGSFRAPTTIIEKRAKAHTLAGSPYTIISPAPFAMWQSVMTHRNKSKKRVDAVQPEDEMPCWHFDRPYFDSKTNSLTKLWKEAWKGAVYECSAIPRMGQKQAKTTSFTPSRSRPCRFLLHQRVITVSTCPVKLNQKRSDPLFWNISNQFRQKKTLKKSFNIIWTPLMVFGQFYQYIVN